MQNTHPLHINIPIAKVDEDQRTVWGYATVEEVDVHGEVISYEASKAAFSNWIGNIREMHSDKAVGKAIEIKFDDANKGVWLGAKISESNDGEQAWIKVKEGVYAGFSIGGSIKEFDTEKINGKDTLVVTKYDLFETSLVDNPACPSATFQVVKNAGGKLVHSEKVVEMPARKPAWWETMYKYAGDQKVKKASFLIYNKNSMGKKAQKAEKTLVKDIYGASELINVALCLRWYLMDEAWEGEGINQELVSALETIKGAAAGELGEPEEWPEALTGAVELAAKTLGINSKEELNKMADKIKQVKKNVFGEETRDADGNVVATPADNNSTRPEGGPDAAVTPKEETVVAAKDDKPVVEPKAETEGGDEPTADDEPTEDKPAEAPKKGKKAAEGGDLNKVTETSDLAKSMGDIVKAAVEAAVKPLEERLEKVESQPAENKAKGSFVNIEKAADAKSEQDQNKARFDELMERADMLAKDPTAGTPLERVQIGVELRKLSRLMDPASVAQHAAIRAALPPAPGQ